MSFIFFPLLSLSATIFSFFLLLFLLFWWMSVRVTASVCRVQTPHWSMSASFTHTHKSNVRPSIDSEEVRGSRTRTLGLQTLELSPAGGGDNPHTPHPVIRLSQTLHHGDYAGKEKASHSDVHLHWSRAENECVIWHALTFVKLRTGLEIMSPISITAQCFRAHSLTTQTLLTNKTQQIKNHQTNPD